MTYVGEMFLAQDDSIGSGTAGRLGEEPVKALLMGIRSNLMGERITAPTCKIGIVAFPSAQVD